VTECRSAPENKMAQRSGFGDGCRSDKDDFEHVGAMAVAIRPLSSDWLLANERDARVSRRLRRVRRRGRSLTV